MKRYCQLIKEDSGNQLYVDSENSQEIIDFVNSDESYKKKFKYVSDVILKRIQTRDVYEKIRNTENIWEIKFFKSVKGKNHRLYCKQYEGDNCTITIVICEVFYSKKTQKIDNRIRNRIKQIEKYEYSFEK